MHMKDIYITHEKGLEILAPHIADAISDVMSAFPAYKNDYPIKNLGNWSAPDAKTINSQGNLVLHEYKSIDWYIERARARGRYDGRWQTRGQISMDQFFSDLSADPFAKKIPQLSILVVKDDLYANGLNFCLGCTKPNAFVVISTKRFVDNNNHLDIEGFKTVVMHEFGHMIGLTPTGRKNSHEQLGTHCIDDGCIMQQRMDGDFRDITLKRLERKSKGLPPICSDCITAGNQYFQREMINQIQKNAMLSNSGRL